MVETDLLVTPDSPPPTLSQAAADLLSTGDDVLRFMAASDPLNLALRDVFMVRLDRVRRALDATPQVA